mmetsp:Transcript_59335/g.117580  ORF Transcript_59335/g.117580 Transcript_59335/m.117580 type:complete len:291 (-) Transcript_59335:622-1494(-)
MPKRVTVGCHRCPSGHDLQKWRARAGTCNGCHQQVNCGEHVMDCRRCNWYLCLSCCPSKLQQQVSRKTWAAMKSLPHYAWDLSQHRDFRRLCWRLPLSCAAAHAMQDDRATQMELLPTLNGDAHASFTVCSDSAPYSDHELEHLLHQLFVHQDLDNNGMLEERELVLLNRNIAIAHYGPDVDEEELRAKYQDLFRTRLAGGDEQRAVPYARFRCYMLDVLKELDSDCDAQKMIVEQFIAEASLGRKVFHALELRSDSDISFLSKISEPNDDECLLVDLPRSTHILDFSPL